MICNYCNTTMQHIENYYSCNNTNHITNYVDENNFYLIIHNPSIVIRVASRPHNCNITFDNITINLQQLLFHDIKNILDRYLKISSFL